MSEKKKLCIMSQKSQKFIEYLMKNLLNLNINSCNLVYFGFRVIVNRSK